jgi:hypothetical protein
MPPVSQGALRKYTWTEQFMIDIGDDLKHTQHWGCEQCGAHAILAVCSNSTAFALCTGYPARELFWKAIHWTPQPLSSMTVWVCSPITMSKSENIFLTGLLAVCRQHQMHAHNAGARHRILGSERAASPLHVAPASAIASQHLPPENRAESFVAPYSGSCAGYHRRSWISDREMRG